MAIPVLSTVLVLAVLGAGAFYVAQQNGVFDPRYEVTNSDGTVAKLKVEELREAVAGDTFPEGIFIDGMSVAGMTKEAALQMLAANQPEAPLEVDINLELNGETLPVDLSSLTLENNLEEVVDEAYNYLRPTGSEDTDTLVAIYNGRQALLTQPAQYNTAYTLHSDGISEIIHGMLDDRVSEAVDARMTGFNVETLTFEYTESSTGFEIDIEKAVNDVKVMLDSGTYVGVVPVDSEVTEPSVSTEDLSSGFGMISSSSSTTSNVADRNHNISITCEKLNGLILQNGETFSFNGYIGPRTVEAGYRMAGVIANGTTDQGLGGGICQVSSMLYQSAIKADLQIVERHWHMWPSTYTDAGTDASVDWPSQDFSFTNNSGYPIAINAYWDPSTSQITINFFGHLLPDGQTIGFEGEVLSRTPASGVQYVADPEMATGTRESVRGSHDGVLAAAYQIWYDANGNEINRVQLENTYYAPVSAQIRVGVRNPDGSLATLNTATGEIVGGVPSDTDSSVSDSSGDSSPSDSQPSDTVPSSDTQPSAETPASSSDTQPTAETPATSADTQTQDTSGDAPPPPPIDDIPSV